MEQSAFTLSLGQLSYCRDAETQEKWTNLFFAKGGERWCHWQNSTHRRLLTNRLKWQMQFPREAENNTRSTLMTQSHATALNKPNEKWYRKYEPKIDFIHQFRDNWISETCSSWCRMLCTSFDRNQNARGMRVRASVAAMQFMQIFCAFNKFFLLSARREAAKYKFTAVHYWSVRAHAHAQRSCVP